MPVLYLAKINLNSQIFDIYEAKLILNDVLDFVYNNMFAVDHEFIIEKTDKYVDSYGNSKEYIKVSKYMFQEIQKKEFGIITGKVVRTYNKPTEKLDKITKRMIATHVEESVSIYFYYDVYKEMVTFCERQAFGYNQFMSAFVGLLNSVGKYEFEIFLQKDKDVLDEKLKSLKIINKVKATLVPPNSNEEDLADLRKELIYMQQCQEANAKKVTTEYISEDMKMESAVMKDIIKAVTRGYGDISATGVNGSGRQQTISSSQDAAFTSDIQEDINESDFNDESRNLISRFFSNIARMHFLS